MKLEDEIKQSKFRSPYQKVTVNILFTNGWLVNQMQEILKPHGITSQQFNILRILRGQHPNPCAINTLRDRMLDKTPDVSRLLDRLIIKKLVERNTCKDDRRKMDVVISREGLALLAETDKHEEGIDKIAANLSLQEAELLSNLLDKLRG